MSNIKILDCTLRDGGYVNNWNFGENVIHQIIKRLASSSVEIVECGFLSHKKEATKDRSIFKTIEEAEAQIGEAEFQNAALMINCGEYSAEDVPQYSGGKINTIRIAFHKHQRAEAQNLCVALKENGFKVFFQPMFTQGYQDGELLELIDWANQNGPEAFYLVDSFGTMRKNDVLRMFYLVDNNLDKNIRIGFHSHNNLQLSFSNAQELIQMHSKREIIIDSSVFGMGRGAGNLCTELLAKYINENLEDKYNIIPILEIMDEYIMPIYANHPWGYSAPYYIAAVNNCHPNYATYLVNKQTLCVRDINAIIKQIPVEERHLYSTELISTLYTEYQMRNVDDRAVVEELRDLCVNRKVLILAPGRTLISCQEIIEKYIKQYNPIVFGINHISEYYNYDKVFVSNLKRFRGMEDAVKRIGKKLICTSNISTEESIDVVNYSSYLVDSDNVSDNAGLMLLNLLKKAGITAVTLAGYDGFDYANSRNYYDEKLINNVNTEKQNQNNNEIQEYILKLKKVMEINFITPSLYNL